jgi:hypothetical protein
MRSETHRTPGVSSRRVRASVKRGVRARRGRATPPRRNKTGLLAWIRAALRSPAQIHRPLWP